MKYICLLSLLLLLTNCSSDSSWLADEEKEKLKGTRIAILKTESPLKTDESLLTIPLTLLPPEENTNWLHSKGAWVPSSGHLHLAAKDLKVRKKYSVGKGAEEDTHLNSTPIIAEGRIYIQDGQGTIRAYAIDTPKKQLWKTKHKVTSFISGGMAYDDGLIIATFGTDEVIAFNAETGETIWRQRLDSVSRSAPVIDQYRAFVVTTDNHLYAIDTSSGKILWHHEGVTEKTTIINAPSPAVYDRYVIAPYSTGEVFALSSLRGTSLWTDIVSSSKGTTSSYIFPGISTTPIIHKQHVFVSSHDGNFVALNMINGRPLWELPFTTSSNIWTAGNFLFTIANNQQLVAIHIPSGGIKWLLDLPIGKDTPQWSGPIIAGDKVFVVGSHGTLLAISPYKGEITSTLKVPEDIYASPIIAHGKMYLLTDHAKLTIVE